MKKTKFIKIIVLIAGLLLATLFVNGCREEMPRKRFTDGEQVEKIQSPEALPEDEGDEAASEISFRLPEGWTISNEGGSISALKEEQPLDSVVPWVLLEFVEIKYGLEPSAQELAQQYLAMREKQGEKKPPQYDEIYLDNRKVYLVIQETDSYWGDWWWSTSIFFEKNGKVVFIELSDKLDNQQHAIEMLISTLEWQ